MLKGVMSVLVEFRDMAEMLDAEESQDMEQVSKSQTNKFIVSLYMQHLIGLPSWENDYKILQRIILRLIPYIRENNSVMIDNTPYPYKRTSALIDGLLTSAKLITEIRGLSELTPNNADIVRINMCRTLYYILRQQFHDIYDDFQHVLIKYEQFGKISVSELENGYNRSSYRKYFDGEDYLGWTNGIISQTLKYKNPYTSMAIILDTTRNPTPTKIVSEGVTDINNTLKIPADPSATREQMIENPYLSASMIEYLQQCFPEKSKK
jgi:hypothetical protein